MSARPDNWSIWNDVPMAGMSAEEQAKRAIGHTLRQLQENPHLAWYINIGSESFGRLTEAYATLTNQPVEVVRRAFANEQAKNPREEAA